MKFFISERVLLLLMSNINPSMFYTYKELYKKFIAEMFSFTLRGEQKSQVAENKTLRKIF
jgi:hypothetical protein